jgi:hypothetical protein
MEAANNGHRASVELRLSDARRDLQVAVEEKNRLTAMASEYRALAAEDVNRAFHRNAEAIKFSLRATGLQGEIYNLRRKVAELEAELAGVKAPAAELTAEQVKAMDETAGVTA